MLRVPARILDVLDLVLFSGSRSHPKVPVRILEALHFSDFFQVPARIQNRCFGAPAHILDAPQLFFSKRVPARLLKICFQVPARILKLFSGLPLAS